MPFDANLVFCDGSADWSHVNLVTSFTYGTPTSIVRNSGGFVVLDLGATKIGGPVSGLAVVLFLPEADDSLDELTAIVEESSVVGFGSDAHELGKLDIAAATKGIILGGECPATIVMRVAPKLRYLRLKAVTTNVGDDFNRAQCLLSPYPFRVM